MNKKRVYQLLGQIKDLSEDIENENYYYGPREDKCKLIRALANAALDEIHGDNEKSQ